MATERPAFDGLRLTLPGGGAALTDLEAINRALKPLGAMVWRLDLKDQPADIVTLLLQATLSDTEKERLKARFLLSRERLLELIAAAGRRPQLPGGGALSTTVVNHGYSYPQLFLMEAGVDYSRFDRFHVNADEKGVGVDEVMQVLSGGGVTLLQHPPGGGLLKLELDCPNQAQGWIVTYDGAYPHIGSISRCAPGSKILMQIIGPSDWTMRYEDDG